MESGSELSSGEEDGALHRLVSISIGSQQTRLNSPTTPSADKLHAISASHEYFSSTESSADYASAAGKRYEHLNAQSCAPAGTIDPGVVHDIGHPDTVLINGRRSPTTGRRSTTGSHMKVEDCHDDHGVHGRRDTSTDTHEGRDLEEENANVSARPPVFRRRTTNLSAAPSLGDDTRFESIGQQVNNRFKAVKDSLQDSRFKLPSISNMSVSRLTPDFLREISGPHAKKHSTTKRFSASSVTDDDGGLAEASLHDQKANLKTAQGEESRPVSVNDKTSSELAADYSPFSHALDQLEGDVLILGGYRGSILRSAKPPHRQLWAPLKVGLKLRKVDLEVGFEDDDDVNSTDTVIPDGMLKHIGPIDISRRLFKRLRTSENVQSGRARIHDYGYDWRLNPSHLSRQLVAFLESLPSNQPQTKAGGGGATVIAHSLGGLIVRHAVNKRPELFKGVVYCGTPQACINILGPLRNGDEVLLSDETLTAQVNFSIRTSFALLPLDGRCFIDKSTKEQYPVDFFDPYTWIEHRLSPCVGRPLAPLATPPAGGVINSIKTSVPIGALPNLKDRILNLRPSRIIKSSAADATIEPNMSKVTSESEVARRSGNIASTGTDNEGPEPDNPPSARTAVTISHDEAVAYLTRTLASVKKFKQELAFIPSHQAANKYPPVSVLYGKNTPTVFGAKVDGVDGIKRADAYDDLAFASGDGVVLARSAMVPDGYRTAKGGIISSERGHVTLLGDLEGIGKCLNAITAARERGVGNGE